MNRHNSYARHVLRTVFKSPRSAAEPLDSANFEDAQVDAQTHTQSFQDCLALPAFAAFRIDGEHSFIHHPEIFSAEK